MGRKQLLPIIAIDILTGAFFGLLKAHQSTTEVIPLFIAEALYAILAVISIVSLISLPRYRRSTSVVLLLCLLRLCEFIMIITTQLVTEAHINAFMVAQVWLSSLEYVLGIFLLVRIPTEYFAYVHFTHFPAFDDHRIELKDAFPREGRHFLVEGPAAVIEGVRAPLGASGGFTEIDFTGSPNQSNEFQKMKLRKLPHPRNIQRRGSMHERSPFESPAASSPGSPDPEEPALKKHQLDLLRPPHLLLFLEKFCVSVIVLVALLQCIFVLIDFRDPSSWDSNQFIHIALLICVWASVGFGITLFLVQVVKLQKITFQGHFFGSTHAHGVVLMVSLVGWIVSFAFSFLTLIVGTPLSTYLPDMGGNPFITCGKAMFTQILPLSFHFYNIFSEKLDRPSNVGKRMKVAFTLVIINVHWMVVGHVFNVGDVSTVARAIATSARAAALASAIDFCFVLMALLSPLAHAFIQFFNLGIMRLSIHQIHLHRSMVVSGTLFAFIHVILHVIAWSIDPTLTFNDMRLYEVASVPYVSGLIMLLGLIGAGITGYELSINLSAPISSFLHLPLSLTFFLAFFVHGYEQIMGEPLGEYMVLTTFFICAGSYILFFFALPVRRMEVDFKQSVWGDVIREREDHFLYLSLKYGNSSSIPPGSFFNIYSVYGSSLLNYTHAHPFPVFSARHGNVEFLIHCRKAKQQDHISFTQQLLVLRPELVYIQGPLQGPACPFMETLGNLSSPVHLYLCGWNAGLAPSFAILEYLKDHGPNFAVKSISCVFNKIANTEVQRKVHSQICRLVSNWESPIPVSIIEAMDIDLRHVLTMADKQNKQIFKNKQELMELWRESMAGCNRWVVMKEGFEGEMEGEEVELTNRRRSGTFGDSGKLLYFCGSEFQHDLFGEGWTYHVETII